MILLLLLVLAVFTCLPGACGIHNIEDVYCLLLGQKSQEFLPQLSCGLKMCCLVFGMDDVKIKQMG